MHNSQTFVKIKIIIDLLCTKLPYIRIFVEVTYTDVKSFKCLKIKRGKVVRKKTRATSIFIKRK